jgi:hypothetical protein
MVRHSPCLDLAPPISTLPPMRYIDHHDLDPLGPNLQHIWGVLFGPTRGTSLNILYFT